MLFEFVCSGEFVIDFGVSLCCMMFGFGFGVVFGFVFGVVMVCLLFVCKFGELVF